ncbi:hypothetical protein N0V90_000707 [Kalmusia sp. IMI 367209]|nr:hypothetical protein N0V90_000707 [Kalmusia sp. IMI 367209]
MFSPSDNPKQALVDLEGFLNKGPQTEYQELSNIAAWLKQLDSAHGSETDVKVVQLLGTAVGKQWDEKHAWQVPYREFGVLAQVLRNLNPSTTSPSLANQYLRVIGNSVAYNVVSEHFNKLVRCLENPGLTRTALAVLYNYGQDFEPGNIQAAKVRLDKVIAQYLASDRIPEEAVDFATTILNRTTEKLTPAQLGDNTSLEVFNDILKTSAQYDEDHFQDYLAILVHYLQDPEFQQKVATPDTVQTLFDLLLDFEFNELTKDEMQIIMQELTTQNNPNETESDETSIILMVRLVNSVSALSATDSFVQNITLESRIVQRLKTKLLSPEVTPSSVCACIVLGNLATSDSVCINMVQKLGLHVALNTILATRQEQAFLYAATGFMRHLTFPESNRPILGEAGLVQICCHLLTKEDPSIRGEAAAILCKLVTNCFPNIRIVVFDTLPHNITLVQLPGVDTSAQPTILHHIVIQALVPSAPLPSTTMKNPMIELGRTLIAILRYIRRPNQMEDVDNPAHHIFNTPAVARPIARLIRQRFYADARSEGLLGLGLVAQTQEGARCIVAEIEADNGLLGAIKEFAGDQRDAQKSNESAGRDYQNAVVLIHGLSSNGGDIMKATMRSDVETLQAELSKLMVRDNN